MNNKLKIFRSHKMNRIIWKDLFPTKLTFIIFIAYMTLFVGQGIFVTASQNSNNSYSYNTITVVLLTEVLKLIISVTLYLRERSFVLLMHDVRKDSDVLISYFVPSALYCLYNNLAFVNLLTFDPTTYYLLLQLRVVVTGFLFQLIFRKYLTRRQWLSLILLTIGCMLKQINFQSDTFAGNYNAFATTNSYTSNIEKNTSGFDFSLSALLILAQTICSCLAGVYNEYILKGKGADVNIFVQNVYMYLDSIACNAFILCVRGELLDVFIGDTMKEIFHFKILIIIFNNAAIGIVTSFFLKYLNSILKTFASALELMFTAVLSYLLFNIPIYLNTALAIAVVSIAIYLYSQSPVTNVITSKGENIAVKRKLLNSIEGGDEDIV